MQIKIYQINTERDNDRAKFQGLFEAEKTKINPEIYDRVFTGDVGPSMGSPAKAMPHGS